MPLVMVHRSGRVLEMVQPIVYYEISVLTGMKVQGFM